MYRENNNIQTKGRTVIRAIFRINQNISNVLRAVKYFICITFLFVDSRQNLSAIGRIDPQLLFTKLPNINFRNNLRILKMFESGSTGIPGRMSSKREIGEEKIMYKL